MAKRARMKGVDVYVVAWKACGASGWVGFDKRRTADLYARDERRKATISVGKGVYKTKKWVCRIPADIGKDFCCTTTTDGDNMRVIEYIQQNYPHCVGEE